ncbi:MULTISPECIES: MerR family transcriptional regulator [unclassified Actinomyces]|uniref:MerR family transcriptional regulator n=1 Tax=unclassified Actinomyces TaxID=2609248 RepID=UPI002017E589|nr:MULTISPECIES: MerR family transcriptional regulator [unclassified Actinomyces]MCL3776927.1 MerR family transcriptional regulator [Actinomyces sp. AC-20-1]MCL3789164.1 MerR family transcriptional regulator [Actinomyces sp. 187325]MCL3792458.1 MerR family transcriptional regulator [Actinomyces sp. 186855]MCL3794235.1 MerR family transcriptional regulator [Actinomyces sp. 217892]
MRVKEMADLAGTTTRTVRHYHRLGLLPVPPTRGAQRDYDTEHLARLLRIRWLVRSGVPLKRVAALLDEDAPSSPQPGGGEQPTTLADLRATRTEIDERIAELEHQRRRVDVLIAKVAAGEALSPLPRVVRDFYSDIEGRLSRPGARRSVRSKQHMMTLLAVSGLFPTTAITLYMEEYNAEERAVVADLHERFDSLRGLDPASEPTRETVSSLVADMYALVARHRRSSRDLMASLMGGRLSPGLWALYGPLLRTAYPDPVQRAAYNRLLALMAADPVLATVIDPTVREEWLRG